MRRRRITLKPPTRLMGRTASFILARARLRTARARALASIAGRIMAERELATESREERITRRAERIREHFARYRAK